MKKRIGHIRKIFFAIAIAIVIFAMGGSDLAAGSVAEAKGGSAFSSADGVLVAKKKAKKKKAKKKKKKAKKTAKKKAAKKKTAAKKAATKKAAAKNTLAATIKTMAAAVPAPKKECGHTWGEWKVVAKATCTKEGTENRTCTKCGNAVQSRSIPALGHKWSGAPRKVEATCTQPGGIFSEVCTREGCGAKKDGDIKIPAKGHILEDNYTVDAESTCIRNGSMSRHCKVCGAAVVKKTIPATGHKFGEEVTEREATCAMGGLTKKTCEICGTTETTVTPLKSHTYGEETVKRAPTCMETGIAVQTCKVCGKEKTRSIPKVSHLYQGETEIISEPTCEQSGKKKIACVYGCGRTITGAIQAKGHTFGEWEVKEATCTEEGYKKATCSECHQEKVIGLPKVSHTYSTKQVTAPTCVKDGKEEVVCTVCHTVISSRAIPATGIHRWVLNENRVGLSHCADCHMEFSGE